MGNKLELDSGLNKSLGISEDAEYGGYLQSECLGETNENTKGQALMGYCYCEVAQRLVKGQRAGS